jgi:hypothetical protein
LCRGKPAVHGYKPLRLVRRGTGGKYNPFFNAPEFAVFKYRAGPSEYKIDPAFYQAILKVKGAPGARQEFLWAQKSVLFYRFFGKRGKKQSILVASEHTVLKPDAIPVQIQGYRLPHFFSWPRRIFKQTVSKAYVLSVNQNRPGTEGMVRSPVLVDHIGGKGTAIGLTLNGKVTAAYDRLSR